MHSMQYAFRDRRARKGDFRKLWIQRINAGARQHGMSYSRLINGLHLAGVEVDRKVLADLAVSDPEAFGTLVETAQAALAGATPRGRGRLLTQRLAFTHRRVRRLRGLLQKRSNRWSERAFVAEGAELIRCALESGAPVESLYISPEGDHDRATQEVCRRGADVGHRVFALGAGVLERVADTVTPQPVLAVLPMVPTCRPRPRDRNGCPARARWSWCSSTSATRATPARCCAVRTPPAPWA